MSIWAVFVCVVGMWAVGISLFAASGLALRAAVQRRLTLGSRLYLWREPMRILEGREAVRVSLTLMVFTLMAGVLTVGCAILATSVLWRVSRL